MASFEKNIPLSLYIHFPWCVKKCPYCDFNSHTLKGDLPEKNYVDILLQNLVQLLPLIEQRPIQSIFMGGGTPSLFSASAIARLLEGIRQHCQWVEGIEITLEANPGTVESARFKAYKEIGINRLSLGIQSFEDKHLKALGRIHHGKEALLAIETVKNAGFTRFNLDLMFGLPQQTPAQAKQDLLTAIAQNPTHLSWYELTLEPNTPFFHQPPTLPLEDNMIIIQEEGQALLQESGFAQYEVSAYSKNQPCLHNLNYWEFGDYLAIGAGAHAKISLSESQQILRLHHFKHPKQYMDIQQGFVEEQRVLTEEDKIFEFFLNTLRLTDGVPTALLTSRTGLTLDQIKPKLDFALSQGWLKPYTERLCATSKGYRFLNDLTGIFLDPYEHNH